MTETAWIVLIIAMAFVAILTVFRNRLSDITLDVKKRTGKMKTHAPGGVNISRVEQEGKDHEMRVCRDNVDIHDVRQTGENQNISVDYEQSEK